MIGNVTALQLSITKFTDYLLMISKEVKSGLLFQIFCN